MALSMHHIPLVPPTHGGSPVTSAPGTSGLTRDSSPTNETDIIANGIVSSSSLCSTKSDDAVGFKKLAESMRRATSSPPRKEDGSKELSMVKKTKSEESSELIVDLNHHLKSPPSIPSFHRRSTVLDSDRPGGSSSSVATVGSVIGLGCKTNNTSVHMMDESCDESSFYDESGDAMYHFSTMSDSSFLSSASATDCSPSSSPSSSSRMFSSRYVPPSQRDSGSSAAGSTMTQSVSVPPLLIPDSVVSASMSPSSDGPSVVVFAQPSSTTATGSTAATATAAAGADLSASRSAHRPHHHHHHSHHHHYHHARHHHHHGHHHHHHKHHHHHGHHHHRHHHHHSHHGHHHHHRGPHSHHSSSSGISSVIGGASCASGSASVVSATDTTILQVLGSKEDQSLAALQASISLMNFPKMEPVLEEPSILLTDDDASTITRSASLEHPCCSVSPKIAASSASSSSSSSSATTAPSTPVVRVMIQREESPARQLLCRNSPRLQATSAVVESRRNPPLSPAMHTQSFPDLRELHRQSKAKTKPVTSSSSPPSSGVQGSTVSSVIADGKSAKKKTELKKTTSVGSGLAACPPSPSTSVSISRCSVSTVGSERSVLLTDRCLDGSVSDVDHRRKKSRKSGSRWSPDERVKMRKLLRSLPLRGQLQAIGYVSKRQKKLFHLFLQDYGIRERSLREDLYHFLSEDPSATWSCSLLSGGVACAASNLVKADMAAKNARRSPASGASPMKRPASGSGRAIDVSAVEAGPFYEKSPDPIPGSLDAKACGASKKRSSSSTSPSKNGDDGEESSVSREEAQIIAATDAVRRNEARAQNLFDSWPQNDRLRLAVFVWKSELQEFHDYATELGVPEPLMIVLWMHVCKVLDSSGIARTHYIPEECISFVRARRHSRLEKFRKHNVDHSCSNGVAKKKRRSKDASDVSDHGTKAKKLKDDPKRKAAMKKRSIKLGKARDAKSKAKMPFSDEDEEQKGCLSDDSPSCSALKKQQQHQKHHWFGKLKKFGFAKKHGSSRSDSSNGVSTCSPASRSAPILLSPERSTREGPPILKRIHHHGSAPAMITVDDSSMFADEVGAHKVGTSADESSVESSVCERSDRICDDSPKTGKAGKKGKKKKRGLKSRLHLPHFHIGHHHHHHHHQSEVESHSATVPPSLRSKPETLGGIGSNSSSMSDCSSEVGRIYLASEHERGPKDYCVKAGSDSSNVSSPVMSDAAMDSLSPRSRGDGEKSDNDSEESSFSEECFVVALKAPAPESCVLGFGGMSHSS